MKKLKLKKKPYSDAAHNVKRRERYSENEEYREKSKDKSRQLYRNQTNKEFLRRDRNLSNLGELASEMSVRLPNGKEARLPILNVPATSNAMDLLYQTVWRWVQRGMLPEPILHLVINSQPVYHVDEVRVFIKAISKHLMNFAYYRKDHEATRKQIFEQIRKVRVQLNLIKE